MAERNCYCELLGKDPQYLRDKGIPEGYCGLCEVCGAPGHIQHFPGARPYTGSWCDACLGTVRWRWTWPRALLLAGLALAAWWILRRVL